MSLDNPADQREHMHEAEGDPARITWLLQSHPPLSKRIQRLDEYIPTLTAGR